jgi:hypothetical protein
MGGANVFHAGKRQRSRSLAQERRSGWHVQRAIFLRLPESAFKAEIFSGSFDSPSVPFAYAHGSSCSLRKTSVGFLAFDEFIVDVWARRGPGRFLLAGGGACGPQFFINIYTAGGGCVTRFSAHPETQKALSFLMEPFRFNAATTYSPTHFRTVACSHVRTP